MKQDRQKMIDKTHVYCEYCWGQWRTAEHDPYDPHEYWCSNCPIQVQCEECLGTWVKEVLHDFNSLITSNNDRVW